MIGVNAVENGIRSLINDYDEWNIQIDDSKEIDVRQLDDTRCKVTVPFKGKILFDHLPGYASLNRDKSIGVFDAFEAKLVGIEDGKLLFSIETVETSYDLSSIPDRWNVIIDPRNRHNKHEIQLQYYSMSGSQADPDALIGVRQVIDKYIVEVQDTNADGQKMNKLLPVAESKEVESFEEVQKLVSGMAKEYPMEETLCR